MWVFSSREGRGGVCVGLAFHVVSTCTKKSFSEIGGLRLDVNDDPKQSYLWFLLSMLFVFGIKKKKKLGFLSCFRKKFMNRGKKKKK